MLVRVPRGWELPERDATPETVVLGRRAFLKTAGLGGAALAAGCVGLDAATPPAIAPPPLAAGRDARFVLSALSDEGATQRYNNFYEFTQDKDVWRHVENYRTRPWTLEVTGLVHRPRTWDIDALLKLPLEERHYRHRCVEAWYMDVPWIGLPLKRLLDESRPLSKARYVRSVSFLKPREAPGQQRFGWYRWPYYEGLRLDEALHELTFLALGLYGKQLSKQSGAPLRVVVPWKYGYKGPKGVVRLELVEQRPSTFWNDLQPGEYSFESNVDPRVPHPRWSQAHERSIDGSRDRPTLPFNGYGEWVAGLYARRPD